MSAASSTRPGGYAEADNGVRDPFSTDDQRSVPAIVERLKQLNYQPFWKDWSPALSTSCCAAVWMLIPENQRIKSHFISYSYKLSNCLLVYNRFDVSLELVGSRTIVDGFIPMFKLCWRRWHAFRFRTSFCTIIR